MTPLPWGLTDCKGVSKSGNSDSESSALSVPVSLVRAISPLSTWTQITPSWVPVCFIPPKFIFRAHLSFPTAELAHLTISPLGFCSIMWVLLQLLLVSGENCEPRNRTYFCFPLLKVENNPLWGQHIQEQGRGAQLLYLRKPISFSLSLQQSQRRWPFPPLLSATISHSQCKAKFPSINIF